MSLDAQRAKLDAYALAMELDLVDIILDEGRSAKTLERQGLQTALSMLAQGKVDALLVTKLDRLIGFPSYGYRYMKELDAQGRRLFEEDPAQQEGLRRIRELFDAGANAEDIARRRASCAARG